MSFPNFLVFRSISNPYARLVKEDGETHGFIRFDGERVWDPLSKFEVETAKSGDGGLVHIRCFHNNKYLVRQSSTSTWIMAAADEPDEDQSSLSCTLFLPIHIGASSFGMVHVQTGLYVSVERYPGLPLDTGLCFRANMTDQSNFVVVDWETIVIMPKHVAFKGDNGKYLSAHDSRRLQFDSDDIGDPTVGFEVLMANDGKIRIKSESLHKIWRIAVGQDGIWTDGDENEDFEGREFFMPIKIEDNVIALRSSATGDFCRRFTGDLTNGFNANISTVAITARLEVTEIVLSRQINNVRFSLLDARIYNQRALVLTTGEAINESQEPNQVELDFSHSETSSTTWNTNTSLKVGIQAEFKARIPFFAEGTVTVSSEISQEFEFGKTVETTTQVTTNYRVTVPPMTLVRVALLATEATYDVPFSYSQRDVLVNGEWIRYEMDDGMFTGVNAYNFRYEAKEEKLLPEVGKKEPTVRRSAL